MEIRKCRVCGKTSDQVPFHAGKNICNIDYNIYMTKWKNANIERVKAYRSTPEFKKKRAESVAKCTQKSPESFLRALFRHIEKPSNDEKSKQGKLNLVCLDVQISYSYLLELYKKQNGRCAILNIPMTHEFNNLRSISIDRIDSSLGYITGNVQLVCQFINTAKKNHSNDECISILNEFMQVRNVEKLS